MKETLRYYFIAIFIISLAIIGTCGMITVEEKGTAMLFGKETKTIQLNAEDLGAELRNIF